MKKIRPKPYVHVRFKPHGQKARWYWAIKLRQGFYQRVTADGDQVIRECVREDGVTVQTEELLVGEPEIENVAVMNLHYGELEEGDPCSD